MSRKDRSSQTSPLASGQLTEATAERLATIVEAAERAAVQVIDEAESEARRHLSEAHAEADRIVAERLATLTGTADSLVAQAEAIRREAMLLLDSLEAAKAELGAGGSQSEAPARPSHLTAVAPVAPAEDPEIGPLEEPEPASEVADPPQPERGTPAGARLLATQMAVSGNSREEIEQRLRNGFDIEDTDAILDAILGPGE